MARITLGTLEDNKIFKNVEKIIVILFIYFFFGIKT